MEINGLEFKQVNAISPESYDIFKGDRQIGYVQLRWGVLKCLILKCKGKRLIYEHVFQDKTDGQFATEEQRSKYLGIVADKLKAYEVFM